MRYKSGTNWVLKGYTDAAGGTTLMETLLRALLIDYYNAALLGKQMEDPSAIEEKEYSDRMNKLIQRYEELVEMEPDEPMCTCGSSISSLVDFFGQDYQQEHITDCPKCGQHTLHTDEDFELCVHCKYQRLL